MLKRKINVYRWKYSEDSALCNGFKMEDTDMNFENTAIIIMDPWKKTDYKEADRKVR